MPRNQRAAVPMRGDVEDGLVSPMLDPKELAPDVPWRFTRVEFEKLGQTDFFADDTRVELIRGVLVTPPLPHPRHEEIIHRLTRLLVLGVRDRAWVRVNSAYAADDYSEVLPDLAVVPPGSYSSEYPSAAWLLVEVALTSLRKDRKVKGPLYAECGVPEYWIVNAEERVVEVHTDPRAGRYSRVVTAPVGATIRLTRLPDVDIPVGDVFG
jgi:Uma2 family endonuclease